MSKYSPEQLKVMAKKLQEEAVMHTPAYRDFLWHMWRVTGQHPVYTKAQINIYSEYGE